MANRWKHTDAPRGSDYDQRWADLAATGAAIHGEADLVETLLAEFALDRIVLDAGCGTGRVAIELAARGCEVLGVDADAAMLRTARAKAPSLTWVEADLAAWQPNEQWQRRCGAAVMAGNVMIFVEPGTEAAVVRQVASAVQVGGLVIAGFQVRPDRLSLAAYDDICAASGLVSVGRYSTWDREPWTNGDYAVSVHRVG